MAERGRVAVDHTGCVQHMDAAAQALWHADLAGRPVGDLFAGGDGPALPRGDRADALCRDGGKCPVAFEVRFADDGITLLVEDVSEERAAQERIQRSAAQLSEAQHLGGIGSWVWDVEADDITWSDELYRIFGMKPQSFQATFDAYMEQIHPADRERIGAIVQGAFQDGDPFRFDHRIVRADGAVRSLHCQGAVDVRDGKPVRMYGVSQDVTAITEAEEHKRRAIENEMEVEHLRELNEARSRMIDTIAHEMNTPLTPMRLQTHLLAEGILGDLEEPQQKAVHVLDHNLSRLSVLLSDLLDVARLEHGQLNIRPQPTDLARLVSTTIEAFEAEAEGHGLRLVAEVDEPVQAVLDPDRMTQVMYNLVSNAIKFSTGGDIHIRIGQDRDGRWFEVQDAGIGLTPDQVQRLFRPFSRVHDDPDRPGNGLGLHICKGIVEQHGGSLTCRSDGAGKGATFRAWFPAKKREDPSVAQREVVVA